MVSLRVPGQRQTWLRFAVVLGPGQRDKQSWNASDDPWAPCFDLSAGIDIVQWMSSCFDSVCWASSASLADSGASGIEDSGFCLVMAVVASLSHVADCWCIVGCADVHLYGALSWRLESPGQCSRLPFSSPLGVAFSFPLGSLGFLGVIVTSVCSPVDSSAAVEPIIYACVRSLRKGREQVRSVAAQRHAQVCVDRSRGVSLIGASALHGSQVDAAFMHGHSCAALLWLWFEGLQSTWSSFLRSWLLFMLFSFTHMVARTCSLQKGHRRRNLVVRKVRHCFAGAPVIWSFFIVAHLLPLGLAGGMGEPLPPGIVPGCSSDAGNSEMETHGQRIRVGSALGMTDTARPPGAPPPHLHVRFSDGDQPDLRFLVHLYAHQKNVTQIAVPLSEASDPLELLVFIHEEHIGDCAGKRVIPVCPQPRSHDVAMLMVDSWHVEMLATPVLIQIYAGPYYSFVEYFVGRVMLQDIRHCVGQLWPAAAKVYVGADTAPLEEDAVFTPTPGLLIRVSPAALIPGLTVDLATRLAEPAAWLYDVDRHGLPELRKGIGKICVLGAWTNQHICSVTRETTSPMLRAEILEQCDLEVKEVTFCSPRRQI